MKIRKRGESGWTLVEIMLVVALIGLLAAIAIPNFIQARTSSNQSMCINNLRQIDAGGQTWATANNKTSGDTYTMNDIKDYFQRSHTPECPSGGQYGPNFQVGNPPTCTVGGHVIQ